MIGSNLGQSDHSEWVLHIEKKYAAATDDHFVLIEQNYLQFSYCTNNSYSSSAIEKGV